VRTPGVERRAFLIGPGVSLIDANDAGSTARNVVENSLGHLELNTEPLKTGSHCAAEIMQSPILDAARLIEGRLGL
jgi:hypothetical protein